RRFRLPRREIQGSSDDRAGTPSVLAGLPCSNALLSFRCSCGLHLHPELAKNAASLVASVSMRSLTITDINGFFRPPSRYAFSAETAWSLESPARLGHSGCRLTPVAPWQITQLLASTWPSDTAALSTSALLRQLRPA